MNVELIAEVASGHGGDLALAKEFIHRFADAGADWVKFQTTRVKHLRPDDPQYAWFERAELSNDAHFELQAECATAGVKFLTTVYHPDEVPFLASLGLEAIKIGSGEAAEIPLAQAVRAARFPRVMVALGITRLPTRSAFYGHGIEFFRCLTRYPCPASWAATSYGPVSTFGDEQCGWSDHCVGLEGCYTALVRGARIIEKHVQLDGQARPPRAYEATVQEFRELRRFADDDPTRFMGRWQYAT